MSLNTCLELALWSIFLPTSYQKADKGVTWTRSRRTRFL